jgi:hypothetical protein
VSWDNLDTGQATGRPALAFEFLAHTTYYRYTSTWATVFVDGQEYSPEVISVEPLELKPNQTDQRLTILCRQDLPVVTIARQARPRLRVRIRQFHMSDWSAVQTFWVGSVIGVSFQGVEARLLCDAGINRVDGLLAPQQFGGSCQWTLGHPWCPVNLANHTFTGIVTAVSGRQVTAPIWAGGPADYFVNGHLITADGRSDTIDEYLPSSGTVRTRSDLGIAVGDTVTAVAGCDGALTTCQGRFGSETNGGLAWGGFRIPPRDPQRGGII